jgi:class 3 adenylate cyclase
VVELAIRIGAHGRQPWRFFTDGWNLFDFVIIALCFLPQTYFASVLRILRLLRLIRILKLANKAQQAEIYRLKHEQLEQAYKALVDEKEKSERLLLNILPILVAQRLKSGEKLIADSYPEASVLFADIVGFTDFSNRISPEELVTYLDDIFRRFDALAERHDLEKIKTIGDCYMVVAGLPDYRPDHATVLAEMAIDMQDAVDAFNRDRDLELQIRVGINSGPVVAGVIGQKKFIYDLWGDTVNVASRMESHGVPGRIQITEATRERLPEDYPTEERGMISVKGKGKVRAYFLVR